MVGLHLGDVLDQTFVLLKLWSQSQDCNLPTLWGKGRSWARKNSSLYPWPAFSGDSSRLMYLRYSWSLSLLLATPTKLHMVEFMQIKCLSTVFKMNFTHWSRLVILWKRFAALWSQRHIGGALDADNTGLNVKKSGFNNCKALYQLWACEVTSTLWSSDSSLEKWFLTQQDGHGNQIISCMLTRISSLTTTNIFTNKTKDLKSFLSPSVKKDSL